MTWRCEDILGLPFPPTCLQDIHVFPAELIVELLSLLIIQAAVVLAK